MFLIFVFAWNYWLCGSLKMASRFLILQDKIFDSMPLRFWNMSCVCLNLGSGHILKWHFTDIILQQILKLYAVWIVSWFKVGFLICLVINLSFERLFSTCESHISIVMLCNYKLVCCHYFTAVLISTILLVIIIIVCDNLYMLVKMNECYFM